MKNFDINSIMEKLSNERKIFHSEADFQFALAWKIKENYPDYEIFLEWPDLSQNQNRYIDIVLQKDGKRIPIELKYKTKELEYGEFYLKTQGAKDLACYDYLKDIERVESLIDSKFEKGFSIFLTNDLGFLNEPNSNVGYKEFSIHDGREISKNSSLNWGESAGEGTTKGRKNPITLNSNYQFNWKDYSDINSNSSNGKFKYLASEILNAHMANEPRESDSLMDELERLGNMYKEGLLTDEEFSIAKKKLLGDK